MNTSSFKAKSGAIVNGLGLETFREILSELQDTYCLSPLQISEAAGFSMAMVVRYALGLEATGGQIMALTKDCLCGAVAAATVRHLVNAGASAMIGIEVEPADIGPDTNPISLAYMKQLEALNALEVPIFLFSQVAKEELESGIRNSHNVIIGLYDEQTDNSCKDLNTVIDSLNEAATPIHAVGAPLEVDVDSGKGLSNPLYASSTISLGAPFAGFIAAKDFIGRHYVCDISIPLLLREKHQLAAQDLFSEQPVVSVEPVTEGK